MTLDYYLNGKNMIKPVVLFFLILLMIKGTAQNIDIPSVINPARPHIYTRYTSKVDFSLKLQRSPWAKKRITDMETRLVPYLDHFEKDSTWLVSRLEMYWKSHHTDVFIKGTAFYRAEGTAPVPTVRYAGSRDGATVYKMPELENLPPYDEREDGTVYVLNGDKGVWVDPAKTGALIEKTNEQILNLAQDAAFLYWYSGKEVYARFALSVWTPYVKGLYYRKFPVNLVNSQETNLTGLTSFEVIHESAIVPVTVTYDFLDKYLARKNPGFAADTLAPVLKKMADNIISNGVPDNNWNIFECRFLAYLALALDNNSRYADGKGASYYLDVIYNKNSPRQAALTTSLKGFDSATGIWHEAPGYSIYVSQDFLKVVLLTDGVMPNRLQPVVYVLKKAVSATAQYLFPDKFSVSFGDSHYSRLSAQSLECLISWSREYKEAADEKQFTRLLKFSQDEFYNRKGDNTLFELFLYVDTLTDTQPALLQDFATPTFYAPSESWFVQRNGFDRQNGLMISANASQGNHSHANGLSMELYGKGYPLAPDFGSGDSYWSANYRDFYSRFAAHNTVAVDGISSYDAMLTEYPFFLAHYYPPVGQRSGFFQPVSFSDLFFDEPSTQSDQRRLLSIIRTSDNTGYYVDIFRSRKRDGKDIKHEYLYHNIGQKATLADKDGQPLALQATQELSSRFGDMKGYDYFTDKEFVSYSQDFKMSFSMKLKHQPGICMNLWMKGDSARQLFSVKSPKSYAVNSVLPEIAGSEIPTLVVRQSGEAWKHPFVSVLEPAYANKQSIEHVISFSTADSEFVGLKVSGREHTEQYIFSDVLGKTTNEYKGYSFTGIYGVASEKDQHLEYLFLGNGSKITKDGYGLIAHDSALSAALEYKAGKWWLYAEQPVELQMPLPENQEIVSLITVDANGISSNYQGKVVSTQQTKVVLFELPALGGKRVSAAIKTN
jgi:hypothetical protein